jgi:hypothetical protein
VKPIHGRETQKIGELTDASQRFGALTIGELTIGKNQQSAKRFAQAQFSGPWFFLGSKKAAA